MRSARWHRIEVADALAEILNNQENIMATLADLANDDAALKTALASLIAMVQTLQAGGTLTPAQQAEVDQLHTDLTADVSEIEAAEAPAPPASPAAATTSQSAGIEAPTATPAPAPVEEPPVMQTMTQPPVAPLPDDPAAQTVAPEPETPGVPADATETNG